MANLSANFIIIHGTEGYPEKNWFPWLKDELLGLGYQVQVPQFPTPEGQTLDSWLDVFSRCEINDDTIIIGHSVGAAFILSLAEKYKFRAGFLVAGFCEPLGLSIDNILSTFVEKQFNWQAIKANCPHFYQINSDNDEYVSIEKAKNLEACLGISMMLLKGAGHINQDSGYTKLDDLLSLISKELQISQNS